MQVGMRPRFSEALGPADVPLPYPRVQITPETHTGDARSEVRLAAEVLSMRRLRSSYRAGAVAEVAHPLLLCARAPGPSFLQCGLG